MCLYEVKCGAGILRYLASCSIVSTPAYLDLNCRSGFRRTSLSICFMAFRSCQYDNRLPTKRISYYLWGKIQFFCAQTSVILSYKAFTAIQSPCNAVHPIYNGKQWPNNSSLIKSASNIMLYSFKYQIAKDNAAISRMELGRGLDFWSINTQEWCLCVSWMSICENMRLKFSGWREFRPLYRLVQAQGIMLAWLWWALGPIP